MSTKKQVEKFAAETSMHGFAKIVLTKRPERRAVWTIIVVFTWVLFSIELYLLVNNYFNYSKKTTNEFIVGGAPFPSITLCNMQNLDYTWHLLHKAGKDFDLKAVNLSFAQHVGRNNVLAYEIAKLADLFWEHSVKSNLTNDQLHAMYSRTTTWANLKQDVLKEGLGHEEEFIIKCSFGNSNCTFKSIDHPYYFRCFTFNPSDTMNQSSNTLLSEGIQNGFSAMLFIGTQQLIGNDPNMLHIPGLSEKRNPLFGSSGVRIVIHPPNTDPYPLTEGHDVPPGYQASIGIVPQRRTRLGKPYGDCATENRYSTMDLGSGRIERNREAYRKISCERSCTQKQVMRECSCYDILMPSVDGIKCKDGVCCSSAQNRGDPSQPSMFTCRSVHHLDAPDKNLTGLATMLKKIECSENVVNRMMTDAEALATCGCHSPCDEFQYSTSYSLSLWPSKGYESEAIAANIFHQNHFLDRFSEEKKKIYKEYAANGADILRDFSKINVFVLDKDVLLISEHLETTVTDLISDIGGQLGLWIGVSVITISEVIEVLITIIAGLFRRHCCRFVEGAKDAEVQTEKTNETDVSAS